MKALGKVKILEDTCHHSALHSERSGLGRPDLDLFEAHYFLALLSHKATLKRKLLDWVIKDLGQAVLGMKGLYFS